MDSSNSKAKLLGMRGTLSLGLKPAPREGPAPFCDVDFGWPFGWLEEGLYAACEDNKEDATAEPPTEPIERKKGDELRLLDPDKGGLETASLIDDELGGDVITPVFDTITHNSESRHKALSLFAAMIDLSRSLGFPPGLGCFATCDTPISFWISIARALDV
mmetsp:Transcript_2311/g.3851  ORF Transcript_2311/g.3851 Transcript_2311/m.3851 type:complete len:161 (+) Transcript_2311:287-769(+)